MITASKKEIIDLLEKGKRAMGHEVNFIISKFQELPLKKKKRFFNRYTQKIRMLMW